MRRRATMRATTAAAAVLLAMAAPASAADEGGANAEQQTQPTPNRGSTAGGPGHGPGAHQTDTARSGDEGPGRTGGPHDRPG